MAEVKKIGDGSAAAAAKFILDNGFLFEINRMVLHPQGLAMEIDLDSNGDVTGFGGLWDYRDDPEGLRYEPETFRQGQQKYARYMRKIGSKVVSLRNTVLGYIEQTEPGE